MQFDLCSKDCVFLTHAKHVAEAAHAEVLDDSALSEFDAVGATCSLEEAFALSDKRQITATVCQDKPRGVVRGRSRTPRRSGGRPSASPAVRVRNPRLVTSGERDRSKHPTSGSPAEVARTPSQFAQPPTPVREPMPSTGSTAPNASATPNCEVDVRTP
jgi:hypothetical protein